MPYKYIHTPAFRCRRFFRQVYRYYNCNLILSLFNPITRAMMATANTMDHTMPTTPSYKKPGKCVWSRRSTAYNMNGMIYVSNGLEAAGLKKAVQRLTCFRSMSQYSSVKITQQIAAL